MATKYDGKDLTFTVDGVQFNADGTSVVMDNEDGDAGTQTFAELANGTPVNWFFQITALLDLAGTSFHTMLWDNAGTEVAFVFDPMGAGVTPTVNKPKYTGNCKIPRKPPVGGQAGETWTYDFRIDIVGEPTKVTA
ncbi:hypothetical protein ACFFOS_27650 [Nocardioides kongjuensis]|uniref:Uncharacterized protein n=1 Tax=Nocardioides kongjuensis TaxID=349522 RepID=A0A852RXD4_9ACTN|nr:hypothetical protein [Nocardioides kongjuensis]NYD33846.1 hypothetical protein [Nocardioides kongjuensis]